MPPRAFLARWLGAGALLGDRGRLPPRLPRPADPGLPGGLGDRPPAGGGRALAGLVLGALAIAVLSMAIQWIAGGDPTGYGGQRQGIYARAGLSGGGLSRPPAGPSGWRARGTPPGSRRRRCGRSSTSRSPGWNAVYFLVGRNVGILPYFLPLLLGFLAFRGDRGRWAIPLAVAAAVARLPGAPAVQFLRRRRRSATATSCRSIRRSGSSPRGRSGWLERPGRRSSPSSPPPSCSRSGTSPPPIRVAENGEYRVRLRLRPALAPLRDHPERACPASRSAIGNGLWVKLLNHNVWRERQGGGLRIAGGSPVELLLGQPAAAPGHRRRARQQRPLAAPGRRSDEICARSCSSPTAP